MKSVTVRFETPPGKQAQVDWSECGRFEVEGKKLTVYAFLMVLGFSRAMYVRFTASMRMAELIACHQAAFAYFGGWPREILYDNMKQVRIGPGKLNEAFMDFAAHHDFAVKTCRAYRPRTKGKVERPVDYLKDNFLAGRTFADIDDLNAQGLHCSTAQPMSASTARPAPCRTSAWPRKRSRLCPLLRPTASPSR